MGRNETCHQKGQMCKIKCTHETSLEAPAEVTVTDASRAQRTNATTPHAYNRVLSDRRHSPSISLTYRHGRHPRVWVRDFVGVRVRDFVGVRVWVQVLQDDVGDFPSPSPSPSPTSPTRLRGW